jgi:hypothetical protein
MPIKIDLPLAQIKLWIEKEKKTKKWVANHLNVSVGVIQRACTQHKIKFEWPIAELKRLVEVDGLKHWEAGDQLGIDHKYVSNLCKIHGIKSQRRGPRSGAGHPDWKGGRTVNLGYVYLYTPDHPYAKKPVPYVAEHRLVMEKHLDRYLLPTEVVHHIDGNKQNNQIENLELFASNGEHLKKELKGRCPNWSEAGKLAIQLGMKKAHANRKGLIPCDP